MGDRVPVFRDEKKAIPPPGRRRSLSLVFFCSDYTHEALLN